MNKEKKKEILQKNYEIVSGNIRTLRLMEHLTQKELEKRAGLHKGAIWRIEHSIGNPYMSVFYKIADALKVSVEVIFVRA